MFCSSLVFVAIFLVISSQPQAAHGAELLDVKSYCDRIAQRLVNQIEVGEVTGNSIPILDFENRLGLIQMGLDASGRVQYHSAFVSKIRSVGFGGEIGSVGQNKSSVLFSFRLVGVSLIYDLRYELKNYESPGTMEIVFPLLNFEIYIVRDHKTGQIDAEDGCRLRFLGPGGSQYDIVTRIHPVNGYTELWTKETRRNYELREGILRSFAQWSETLKPTLVKAAREVPFPTLQYA